MLQQQVRGKLLRPGVWLEVLPFPHSGILGLALMLWGPWSFRSTGNGRKEQTQNSVMGLHAKHRLLSSFIKESLGQVAQSSWSSSLGLEPNYCLPVS